MFCNCHILACFHFTALFWCHFPKTLFDTRYTYIDKFLLCCIKIFSYINKSELCISKNQLIECLSYTKHCNLIHSLSPSSFIRHLKSNIKTKRCFQAHKLRIWCLRIFSSQSSSSKPFNDFSNQKDFLSF